MSSFSPNSVFPQWVISCLKPPLSATTPNLYSSSFLFPALRTDVHFQLLLTGCPKALYSPNRTPNLSPSNSTSPSFTFWLMVLHSSSGQAETWKLSRTSFSVSLGFSSIITKSCLFRLLSIAHTLLLPFHGVALHPVPIFWDQPFHYFQDNLK